MPQPVYQRCRGVPLTIVNLLPTRMNAPESSHKLKASFKWDDPFLLEDQLTPDERMVRDAAQAYARDKLAPRILEAFRHEKTDPSIFRELGELGVLGCTLADRVWRARVELRLLRA